MTDKLSTICFFRKQATAVRDRPQAAPELEWTAWRPSGQRLWPTDAEAVSALWGLMHQLRLFQNREYGQMLAYRDGTLVHRSYVFPGWFRFPFMRRTDLQIGDTWTSPAHRGQGIATAAIERILDEWAAPDRCFWYVVSSDNTSSIRAIQKAGFELAGTGQRGSRWGIRLLGSFVMDTDHSAR
jgi:RimJ/RimL family protein N-acetyltransferase